ncbi:hypothetical protein AVEN_151697-1 [Araneus ventricosus]|uniref:Uncharacterized protein n=1 Tax=Araneus ventricosus TaxID=182803 RepID=A0A4Y2MPL2_ARAVE|nr:hypothetical protein AVEN_151697-1 [Araneus ventricosus]
MVAYPSQQLAWNEKRCRMSPGALTMDFRGSVLSVLCAFARNASRWPYCLSDASPALVNRSGFRGGGQGLSKGKSGGSSFSDCPTAHPLPVICDIGLRTLIVKRNGKLLLEIGILNCHLCSGGILWWSLGNVFRLKFLACSLLVSSGGLARLPACPMASRPLKQKTIWAPQKVWQRSKEELLLSNT